MRRVCAPLVVDVHDRRRTRSPPSPARADLGRSPFVRLRELLGDAAPGKPAISLAVGEPQHAVPSFVGPVLAAHIEEFGRYPMNKGLDEFVPGRGGLARRRLFKLPRPIDPANEVLVLNGSREGLFLAAIAAARWVSGRRGRPAMLIPNPFYAAYAAGAVAADCEPVYLPATAATGFLPDLDALSGRSAGAHRGFLHRLARQPAGRGRRPRLSRAHRRAGPALRIPGFQRRMLFGDLHQSTRRRACSKRRRRISPTSSSSSRSPNARTCRGCASALPPATATSSRAFSSCATSQRRRCRCRRSGWRSPPMPTRRMSTRTGGSMRRNSISPIRSSATATAIGGRPAVSFSGSTFRHRAATRRWRCGCGARRGCASCRAAISRASRPTAPIPARGYIRVAMVQDRRRRREALHRLVAVLG